MPRNYALAGQLFESAAAQGHGLGMYFMARLLENGAGTPPDPVGAFVLYEQASRVHPPAAEARDALKKILSPDQLKAAQAQLEKARAKGQPTAGLEAAPADAGAGEAGEAKK